MKRFVLALLLLSSCAAYVHADALADAAIAKARAATGKLTVEADAEKPHSGGKDEKIKRRMDEMNDRKGSNLQTSSAKGTLFKVSPGSHPGVKLTQDSCIVEGVLAADKLAPEIRNVVVDAENCVIRNVLCRNLRLCNGAKVTVVDSTIGWVVFDDPGMDDEAKKTKCELIAGNCTVSGVYLEGPRSYIVQYVNTSSGGRHDEPVSVNNNKCQFKFKNCSLLLKRPLTTEGMVGVTFSKCVISQSETPYKIGRAMDGKCSFEFEDCAIFQRNSSGSKAFSDPTGNPFIQNVRQESGKAIMRGKLPLLSESPFPCETSKERAMVGKLWNMDIDDNSPIGKLGLGALIGNSGMPAPTKAAAKAQPTLKGADPKSDDPNDEKVERELEEAVKKLNEAKGK
jgi:hypothetical protein